MVPTTCLVLRAGERFSEFEAGRLAELVRRCSACDVIVDMGRVLEATLPALARLVLMRRELTQRGSDMRLAAVRGQPARLIENHRLQAILPRINDLPDELIRGAAQFRPLSSPFPAENAGGN